MGQPKKHKVTPRGRRSRRSARIFISHSSSDKPFAKLLASTLRKRSFEPWIDHEQILTGDDILERLGAGLTSMDLLVLLISRKSLRSSWVERELKFAGHQEITRKRILILPFILDETPVEGVPWFLRYRHVRRIRRNTEGANTVVGEIRRSLQRRLKLPSGSASGKTRLASDPRIDGLIKNVRLGDWEAAAKAAIVLLRETDADGRNELFGRLLDYQNRADDDSKLWGALHTIESTVSLAPWLLKRVDLERMASNPNFSVRSAAASICMRLAQFAPELVPLDILLKLSVYDEDWYVQAPANAALQALVRPIPETIQVFYNRLGSSKSEEREHASNRILEIAKAEPELLERDRLRIHLSGLTKKGDKNGAEDIAKALKLVRRVKTRGRYRYGI